MYQDPAVHSAMSKIGNLSGGVDVSSDLFHTAGDCLALMFSTATHGLHTHGGNAVQSRGEHFSNQPYPGFITPPTKVSTPVLNHNRARLRKLDFYLSLLPRAQHQLAPLTVGYAHWPMAADVDQKIQNKPTIPIASHSHVGFPMHVGSSCASRA